LDLKIVARRYRAQFQEAGMKIAVGAVLVALLASPCVAQTPAGETEKAKQQYLEALNEGDAAMLARMSTERAILLPPNAEMIEGREAIEKYWRTVFAAGLKDVSARTVRVDGYGGDAVREIGRIRLNAPAPRDVLEGKYVIIWRKTGENWLLSSLIWNFTQPAVQ
jgi:ketosteroid isomerase-like protein